MQKFQSHDGTTLAYSDEGEGLPVLCLAGLTRNASDFDYLAPLLPPVRLIRLDEADRLVAVARVAREVDEALPDGGAAPEVAGDAGPVDESPGDA